METLPIFVGQTVGRWLVVGPTYVKNRRRFWTCRCECGTVRDVAVGNLARGLSKSCGCGKGTHLHSRDGIRSPTMRSYDAMMSRCYHPSSAGYGHYSGQNITVCDRWRFGENGASGFQCFLNDMGERPPAQTLDRIKNELGYSRDNCRWASREAQARNRRTTQTYLYNGREMLLREIAAETGMSFEALRSRIKKRGMSIDEALRLPVQRGMRFNRDVPLRILEYNGKMMTVRQIADATGINYNSLRARLAAGEPLETALR